MKIHACVLLFVAALTGAYPAAQSPWQDVIRNLRHPDPGTRLGAVEALGTAGFTPAAGAVAPLLVDPDDRVQAAAIEAELAFFLTDRVGSTRFMGIGSSRSPAQQAFEAGPLLRGAAPAPPVLIDRLIAAVRDENERIRFDAVHVLGFIAERPLTSPQAAALVAELDHYDPIIRAAVARTIARLHVAEANEALLSEMQDSNELVRRYSTEALGVLREERAAPALRDLVTRGRGDIVADAVLALARLGIPMDAPRFRQWVTDRNAVTRRAGAEGLGWAKDRESIPVLQGLLKADKSASVRLAAMFALQQMGEVHSHTIAVMLAQDDDGLQAREYLLELGPVAVPGVRSALQATTDSRARAELVMMLGHLGTIEDLAIVEPLLKERDDRVRRAAEQTITRLRR